jgi:hypothetical protein
MHDKHFWDLIDWTNAEADHPNDREDALEGALRQLSLEEIEDFYLLYHQKIMSAWTTDMQLVAFLVNHGGDRMIATDLLVFLHWLIDRGKSEYDSALSDPDRLAEVDEEPRWDSEGYHATAVLAWEIETGAGEQSFFDSLELRGVSYDDLPPLPAGPIPSRLDARERFPALYHRFIEGD